MSEYDKILARLAQSPFRSRFRLDEKDKAYRGLTGLLDDDFFVMTVDDTESVYFDDKEMNKLVNNIMEHIKKKLIITIDYLL